MKKLHAIVSLGKMPPPVPHLDNLSLLFKKNQREVLPAESEQVAKADEGGEKMVEKEESYEYEMNGSQRYKDLHVLEIMSFGSELTPPAHKHKVAQESDTPEAILARALQGNQAGWSRSLRTNRRNVGAFRVIGRDPEREKVLRPKDLQHLSPVSSCISSSFRECSVPHSVSWGG